MVARRASRDPRRRHARHPPWWWRRQTGRGPLRPLDPGTGGARGRKTEARRSGGGLGTIAARPGGAGRRGVERGHRRTGRGAAAGRRRRDAPAWRVRRGTAARGCRCAPRRPGAHRRRGRQDAGGVKKGTPSRRGGGRGTERGRASSGASAPRTRVAGKWRQYAGVEEPATRGADGALLSLRQVRAARRLPRFGGATTGRAAGCSRDGPAGV